MPCPLESKFGQKLLEEQTACSKRNTAEEIHACQDKVADQFDKILSGSDLSSEFLKAKIDERLAEWLAANTWLLFLGKAAWQ